MDDPWEWRAAWMSGLIALAQGKTADAQSAFNAVYGQVPGELAPKLALAFACETGGEHDVAESLYVTCARTDASYIAPAAFGLARIRSGRGDVEGAIRALDLVPATSRAFTPARRRRASLQAESGGGLRSLASALESIDNLTIDPVDRSRFRVDVLAVGARDRREGRRGPGGQHRRPAGDRALAARRAGGGVPRPGRARQHAATSGSAWSTRPTPYAAGPLR